MHRHVVVLAVLATTVFLPTCRHRVTTPRPPQTLVSPVRDLTRALRAEIRYRDTQLPDNQLLQSVFTSKPALARAFSGIPVTIRRGPKEVVVLVCTPNGTHATHEDASWTPMIVDRTWYETDPTYPCAFDPTLDPKNPR
jgi:hypothetical protein